MIVVTGASGQLGRAIIERLIERVSPQQIGASVRDPAKVADLSARGIRVRHGDFVDADSLAHAFKSASQVLMISSNARASGGDTLAQHRVAIEAARAAGVQRIVYTSHIGASASSAFAPMLDHAATEDMLEAAGIAWTALRNGFYASTVPTMIGDAASSGVLAAPQDGKVSWTAHRDLADGAAAVLLEEGRFEGPTPPLTASEALDLDDIAGILSDIHGRHIQRRSITDEDQATSMTARGLPPMVIAITLSLYRAARAGEFTAVDPTLATLIGRKPISVREVLATESDI